jgi:hypothetical protein
MHNCTGTWVKKAKNHMDSRGNLAKRVHAINGVDRFNFGEHGLDFTHAQPYGLSAAYGLEGVGSGNVGSPVAI